MKTALIVFALLCMYVIACVVCHKVGILWINGITFVSRTGLLVVEIAGRR